jgi:hypothetical protein
MEEFGSVIAARTSPCPGNCVPCSTTVLGWARIDEPVRVSPSAGYTARASSTSTPNPHITGTPGANGHPPRTHAGRRGERG